MAFLHFCIFQEYHVANFFMLHILVDGFRHNGTHNQNVCYFYKDLLSVFQYNSLFIRQFKYTESLFKSQQII